MEELFGCCPASFVVKGCSKISSPFFVPTQQLQRSNACKVVSSDIALPRSSAPWFVICQRWALVPYANGSPKEDFSGVVRLRNKSANCRTSDMLDPYNKGITHPKHMKMMMSRDMTISFVVFYCTRMEKKARERELKPNMNFKGRSWAWSLVTIECKRCVSTCPTFFNKIEEVWCYMVWEYILTWMTVTSVRSWLLCELFNTSMRTACDDVVVAALRSFRVVEEFTSGLAQMAK